MENVEVLREEVVKLLVRKNYNLVHLVADLFMEKVDMKINFDNNVVPLVFVDDLDPVNSVGVLVFVELAYTNSEKNNYIKKELQKGKASDSNRLLVVDYLKKVLHDCKV